MFTYLLQGLTLGFTAGVQPGPYQTYIIAQTMQNGWRRTLVAALAPLVSDLPIVLLCLFVLTRIPAWLQRGLYLAGGLFVLYLALGAFKQWQNFVPQAASAPNSGQKSLLQAGMMNALSPGPYLFWSLVNGPILLRAWGLSPSLGLAFLLGFYVAILGVNAAIILLFGLAAHSGERVRRALIGLSALALTLFGLYQLWLGLSGGPG
jgi:threonine/homoserine/homoserine lactone efflux protein